MKTWREKLEDSKGFPRVQKITEVQSRRWGKGTIVIPAPREVDGLMRKVRRGKVTTINSIRQALARRHGATIACPICTGIFASIAARAAEEDLAARRRVITPYWRTLKEGGILNERYPGGAAAQRKKLREEGHKVIPKGKNLVVADFEKKITRL